MSKNVKVSTTLNHAAYTFRTFEAADWRATAQECMRRADAITCVDCGEDVGFVAAMRRTYPTGRLKHRRINDRYSCGVTP